eukprot:3937876-Rhodomonas_salina.5
MHGECTETWRRGPGTTRLPPARFAGTPPATRASKHQPCGPAGAAPHGASSPRFSSKIMQ